MQRQTVITELPQLSLHIQRTVSSGIGDFSVLVLTDSLDSLHERWTGVFSTTEKRDLAPKRLNHFHTLKTLKTEINVKLLKCPSAPMGD